MSKVRLRIDPPGAKGPVRHVQSNWSSFLCKNFWASRKTICRARLSPFLMSKLNESCDFFSAWKELGRTQVVVVVVGLTTVNSGATCRPAARLLLHKSRRRFRSLMSQVAEVKTRGRRAVWPLDGAKSNTVGFYLFIFSLSRVASSDSFHLTSRLFLIYLRSFASRSRLLTVGWTIDGQARQSLGGTHTSTHTVKSNQSESRAGATRGGAAPPGPGRRTAARPSPGCGLWP